MENTGTSSNIQLVPATKEDLDALERIRQKAFAPVFDSFRTILGDTIYEHAQRAEDEEQADVLVALFGEDSVWENWKLLFDGNIAGFVSIRLDVPTRVGEIGLNAVDPAYAKRGLGTHMYQFAVRRMKEAGMKVATVATGGDPSHLPARKAYRNAGFTVEIPSVWMCQELV